MKRLLAQFRRFGTLYASTKGAPPKTRRTIIRKRVSAALLQRARRVSRRGQTGHVTLAYRLFPARRANWFFWKSRTVSRSWYDIETRMSWLAKRHPNDVEDFVREGLKTTLDPVVLINLARNQVSAPHVKRHLAKDIPLGVDDLDPRFHRSQSFSGAYVGILMFTEGPSAASHANTILSDMHPLPRRNYRAILDSVSTRIREHGETKQFESGFYEPKSHRLLIVESAKAHASYRPLMLGAERITLFDMSDIYATADLSVFDDADLPPVTIEHIRTRITRFSREYHDAHDESKLAAARLTSFILDKMPKGHMFTEPLLKRHVELDVADQIFFELLKVRAIEKLFASDEFDHIVIALNAGKPTSLHYRTFSCVSNLEHDERVEFTSVSSQFSQRLLTQTCANKCAERSQNFKADTLLEPTADIFDDLIRKCDNHVERSVVEDDSAERSIATLINFNSAYNASTSSSISALKSQFELQTLFVGGSLNSFLKEDPSRADVLKQTNPKTMSWALLGDLSDFSRWCLHQMSEGIQTLDDERMSHLCRCFVDRITTNGVMTGLSLFALTHAWCKKRETVGQLPALALVTTQRSAKLGIMAEAMRQFMIPSLAIEPHGLNGNYCRYSKVAMDQYAVISQYFMSAAEQDFGIGRDRCHVVGTPRIVAPKNYSPKAARASARSSLMEEHDIIFSDRKIGAFFCQPSEWAHVDAVWKNILSAAKRCGADLLLKPHPEESPSRVARYLKTAEALGMAEHVQPVSGKPDTVIEACDFILTGYSAAALDAAVLSKPVICVTANGKSYPVDQHAIVNAPLCGSAEELAKEIDLLVSQPSMVAKRAADFLSNEPQFVDGPDDRLRTLVASLMDMNKAEVMRPLSETPESLFLDGPFKEYSV